MDQQKESHIRYTNVLAELTAQAAHDGQTAHDAHYTTIHGVVFAVATLYLADPVTKQDFTLYEAVTVHARTDYVFLVTAFSTANPSYLSALHAAMGVVSTVRFLPQ